MILLKCVQSVVRDLLTKGGIEGTSKVSQSIPQPQDMMTKLPGGNNTSNQTRS